MRGPSEDIYELIQSMSGSERRFLQLYAKRHAIGEAKNYGILFNLIASQNTYDEPVLKTLWAQHGNPQHFAVIKQQLYQQLLQSLHLFHAATDPAEQVRIALHQAEILINRGLYAQAAKLLQKQEKAIAKLELLELWPAYFSLKRKLWGKQYYKGITPNALEQVKEEEHLALDTLKKMASIRHTAETIGMLHYQKVSGRTDADRAVVTNLLAGLPPTDGQAIRAQMDILQAKATGAFMLGQAENAYRHNAELVKLMEGEGLVKRYAERYFSALNNYLVDCQVLGKSTDVVNGLKKLRALPTDPSFKKMPRLELNIFRLGYQLELNLALSMGQFAEVNRLAQATEAGLLKFDAKIVPHNVITFRYLLAYLYFGNGQWAEALERLNYIINTPETVAVQEIQGFARLLALLAHYEAGHYRLLESMIEQVYRYQKQRKQLFETEKQILSFLRKVNFVDERHIRQALFRALHDRLTTLKQHALEKRAFNYFDFEIWARAHLKNRPFATVYQGTLQS